MRFDMTPTGYSMGKVRGGGAGGARAGVRKNRGETAEAPAIACEASSCCQRRSLLVIAPSATTLKIEQAVVWPP